VTTYDDVSARARGLATHLLAPEEWQALADVPDLPALAARLEHAREPLHLRSSTPDAALVERAVRRRAAKRLALLARWCGDRPALLEAIFGDEDRRSLRALVRGAAVAAPPEARLAGTISTPALPLRALETLAVQPSVPALAALLVAWRHPAASALEGAPRQGPPDLLLLDSALTREFAARALAAARQGDAALRWHLGALVDQENVLAALALAESGVELEPAALFVEGGSVPLAAVERVARARPRLPALQEAQQVFRGTVFEEAFTEVVLSLLAQHLAAAHRAHLHAAARTDPLGSAPVLDYALRLRDEVERFQQLAWGLALDAPLAERLGEVHPR
jgi:V/A-type H+/Na+-transporting ATPase subunit C